MTTQVKAITLRASYESDLSGFKSDAATIKSFRKQLEKTPIRVPVRLDLSGIKSDATRAAAEYKKALGAALSAVPAGGSVSKGGIIIPAGAAAQLKDFAATSKGVFKQVTDGGGKVLQTFEQLEAGVQRVTTRTKKGGKNPRIIDTRPLEDFQKKLAQIERKYAGEIGKTRGAGGDVASVLKRKSAEIAAALNDPKLTAAIKDTPVFQKADKSLDRLEQRIAEGSARNVKGGRVDALKERLLQVNEAFSQGIGTAKGTKGDVAAVLEQKRAAIQKSLTEFADLQNDPAFKSARKSLALLDGQIANAQPTQARAADKARRAGRAGELRDRLQSIDDATAGNLGRAQGGRAGVAGVLAQKRREIGRELANFADIADSAEFRKAQKAMTSLEKQFFATQGREDRQQEQKTRKGRTGSLNERLLAIDTDTSTRLGKAKGNRGDVAAILAEKRNRIAGELSQFADIADSAEFKKAQRAINTLNKQIGQAEPTQERRAKSEQRQDFNRRTDAFIKRQDNSLERDQIKQNKLQETIAKRNVDQVTREAEVNRVLDQRGALMEKQVAQYRKLADLMRARGQNEAANKYTGAANRIEGQVNQLKLDRERGQTQQMRDESDSQLKRRLNSLLDYQRTQNEIFKNEEAAARRNKTMSPAQKDAALADIAARRERQRLQTLREVQAVEAEAGRRGNRGLRDRATGAVGGLHRQGITDMRKLAAATTSSGHAFDFHTSSLLRNAATFTKWYVPAQLAMGAFASIGRGIASAVDAQRTFKILNAVFRGTGEDAALLADQTMALAAANGRSAQEAADAAVAWARIGLTRNQVLIAMESSLRAANVAEIDAAEATAYLTANYKAFNQTISDIPATLDYINALSNKNPVAPKEIFEGLSRSAATAKVAGFEFQKLAALITTVTATTQRPGQEVGNSINTVLTRLRRPRTVEALNAEFRIDVTNAEGDAKKVKDILADLAALYPTLNRLEKARLSDIVAGARQGNRFAIVMESWTDSLIAQAKAGVDANSAMRENAQILDSVSAKLQALSTSWTRLFHVVGESGAFDALSFGLEAVGNQVESLTGNIKEMADDLGGLFDGGAGGGSGGNYLSRFASQYSRYRKSGLGFGMSAFATGTDLVGGRLPEGENQPSNQLAATRLGKLAEQTSQDQNRAQALDAADEALRIMATQFGSGGVSNRKVLKQFDELVDVLGELPGGQANVAKARKDIRPMLESGDVEGSRAALRGTADTVREFNKEDFTASEERRQKALKITEDTIEATRRRSEALNTALANTKAGPAQDKLQMEYYQTEQALKDQQDTLKRLQQAYEQPVPDWFAEHKGSLEDYLADLKLIGEVYGELVTSFGSTGFANLDSKMKLGGARMEQNMIGEMLDRTRAENAPLNERDERVIEARREFDSPEVFAKEEERIRARMDVRSQSETFLATQLDAIREATAEAERKIELERQTATLRTGYDDSRRSTAAGFGRYETGQSEGSRMASRTAGIFRELSADVGNAKLGAGDPLQDARELGDITERMTQAKEGLFSMDERINRALAERVNLEGEIAEENRKQNEEASKRLVMASREDQLRAAAAAAVLRSRGKSEFSMNEFQFFSQETRGAIQNFAPRSVKGLDDTEANQAEARGKLDNEIAGLAVTLRSMRKTFDELIPQAEEKAGNILDPNNPLGRPARTAGEVIKGDKNEVRMNLNTGPISVSIDFARHVQTIKDALQVSFDTRLTTEMARLRDSLRMSSDPEMGPVLMSW